MAVVVQGTDHRRLRRLKIIEASDAPHTAPAHSNNDAGGTATSSGGSSSPTEIPVSVIAVSAGSA